MERYGGRVIVQDPAEADYDGMPRNAVAVTEHPIVTATAALASEVVRLTMEETSMPPDLPEPDAELVAEISGLLAGNPETNTDSRRYSDLTCPECGGPLYASQGGRAQTYDCLVGHRWAPESLFEEQAASVERALWLAIRALEERGRLTTKLAAAAVERGHVLSATQFSEAADEAARSADIIRVAANGMTSQVAPEAGEA